MASSASGGYRIAKAFEASKSVKKKTGSFSPRTSAKGRMGELVKRNTSPKSVNRPPPNRKSKSILKMTNEDWSHTPKYSGKAWDARETFEAFRQRRSSNPTHGMRKR